MKLSLFSCLLLGVSAFGQNTAPFWSTNGNNNTSLSNKIGTTNNVSVRFVTNNIERMKIHYSGRVGIGTAGPHQKLHVVGKGLFTKGLIVPDGIIQVTNPTTYALHARSQFGILVESPLTPDDRHGFGPGIAITGIAHTGVNGIGGLGVFGYAVGAPEEGTVNPGIGVLGVGWFVGVEGTSGGARSGTGILGTGDGYGVVGNGGNQGAGVLGIDESNEGGYGIMGKGTWSGVFGSSINGDGGIFLSENGTGIVATTENGDYAGKFHGDVYTTGTYLTSDINLKHNIEELSDGLGMIKQMKPRYYEFKNDERLAPLNLPEGKRYGLVAQELEEVLPRLVKSTVHSVRFHEPVEAKIKNGETLSPILKQKNRKEGNDQESLTIKSVNYIELIPIMIKGMQELMDQNEKMQQEIDLLREIIRNSDDGRGITSGSKAWMKQNTPNPFKGSAIVQYFIPSDVTSAIISFTNVKGQQIKAYTLSSGSGYINFNSGTLPSGVYNYSLVVNGKTISTKQLTISR